MKTQLKGSLLFEGEEFSKEVLVEALEAFVEKFKRLELSADAVYPAEPAALPFAYYLSQRLGLSLRSDFFLRQSDSVLLLFSFLPYRELTPNFFRRKVRLFRERFPRSPSMVLAAPFHFKEADFQLLKTPFKGRFLESLFNKVEEDFYWPTEGDFLEVSPSLAAFAQREAKELHRLRRVMNAAREFDPEALKSRVKVVESDLELVLWERFKKSVLTEPEEVKPVKPEEVKVEKLFQLQSPQLTSAVTALLEFLAQSLEESFPTHLAYSNYEVYDREGVSLVPRVKEELNGADVRLEIIYRGSNPSNDFKKLFNLIDGAVDSLNREILGGEAFKPQFDFTVDLEIGKATLYLSWFIDAEMAEKLYRRVNRDWLLGRLLHRKRIKGEVAELLRFLEEFTFNAENLTYLTTKFEALWRKGAGYLKVKGKKIAELLSEKKLWSFVAVWAVRKWKSNQELFKFLLSLKGFESYHQLLAELDCYYLPVSTKRIYRPNWEKLKRDSEEPVLKGDLLGGSSDGYRLYTPCGSYLGELCQPFCHYLAAKERAGKRLKCSLLYFDSTLFSEDSFWVKVETVKES
jgi:hypothetical protein